MSDDGSNDRMPLTVSEAARRVSAIIGTSVPPKLLSDMLYRRELDGEVCALHAGRRMIPAAYLGVIASKVRRRHAH